jgi:hypothetical protein
VPGWEIFFKSPVFCFCIKLRKIYDSEVCQGEKYFSKVLYILILRREYTRVLTFQNFWQGLCHWFSWRTLSSTSTTPKLVICVCMYVCIRIYVHVYVYGIYSHGEFCHSRLRIWHLFSSRILSSTSTNTKQVIYMCLYVCMRIHTCVCVYACMYVLLYALCVGVCWCVSVCVQGTQEAQGSAP